MSYPRLSSYGLIILLTLMVPLGACISLQPSRGAKISTDRLMSQLMVSAGTYDNFAQVEAAPTELIRPAVVGHPYDWLDRQSARFVQVSAPALGQHVFYLEWYLNDRAGAVSRQRLWRFRDQGNGQVVMDFFTFKNPASVLAGWQRPDVFKSLTESDLIGYGPGCALVVSGTNRKLQAITPPDCIITARSGRRMTIRAKVVFAKDRIAYQEAGILADGSYAFLVPGKETLAYDFRRVP